MLMTGDAVSLDAAGTSGMSSRLGHLARLLVPAACLAMIGWLSPRQAIAVETIVFCLEKADVRPWRTQDNGGLNIDLLNQVARKLNVNFEYRGMPWKRCLTQLKANEVSGAIGGSYKVDRLEMGVYPGRSKLDVSKRLNFDRYVVMRAKGTMVDWDGNAFQNLNGPVGIQLGYSISETLRDLGVKIDESDQRIRDLAIKLTSGQLSAAAVLDGEASAFKSAEPSLAAHVEVLPTPLVEKPYFLIFSHSFAATRSDMANRIWNTIEEVRNSQEYQKLEREAFEKPQR